MLAELLPFGLPLWVQVFQEHGNWFSPLMIYVNWAWTEHMEVSSSLKKYDFLTYKNLHESSLNIIPYIYMHYHTYSRNYFLEIYCQIISTDIYAVWYMAYVYSIQCMLLSSSTFSRSSTVGFLTSRKRWKYYLQGHWDDAGAYWKKAGITVSDWVWSINVIIGWN